MKNFIWPRKSLAKLTGKDVGLCNRNMTLDQFLVLHYKRLFAFAIQQLITVDIAFGSFKKGTKNGKN